MVLNYLPITFILVIVYCCNISIYRFIKKAKKLGMDEDKARYLDIEQMVKRELRDAERVYVNGILQNGLES